MAPVVDVERLAGDASDDKKRLLHALLEALGVRQAVSKDVQAAVVQALAKQHALVTDPRCFWALQALATQRLGAPSLAAFVGESHVTLKAPAGSPPDGV